MLLSNLFSESAMVEGSLKQMAKSLSVPQAPTMASTGAAPATAESQPPQVFQSEDEKAAEARVVADRAAEKIAIRNIVAQLKQQLANATTRDDLTKVKQSIDRAFVQHGLVSESAFEIRDRLIESVDRKRV